MTGRLRADPYGYLSDRLSERAGLRTAGPRLRELRLAADRAMKRVGLEDPVEYALALETGRVSLADLIDEVTVSETYFFREPHQFAFLAEIVLPERMASRPADRPLRVWSAACSSGEEAYSLAIALEEAGLGPRATLIASDIDRDALAKARSATYGKWSFRGGALIRAERYLVRDGDKFTVNEFIRGRVDLRRVNLASDAYPSSVLGLAEIDVIFCRNALIYFEHDAITRIFARFSDALAPGGWLFVASSDPSPTQIGAFEAIIDPRGVFYRKKVRSPAPRSRVEANAIPAPLPPVPVVKKPRAPEPPRAPSPAVPATTERDDHDRLVEEIRQVADHGDVARAERLVLEAVARFPLDATLYYVRAILLKDRADVPGALDALRRAMYLDPSLLMAHVLDAALRYRVGDARGARGALRRARALASNRGDGVVPLSDGASVEHVLGELDAMERHARGRTR